jgi:hypothetical protein
MNTETYAKKGTFIGTGIGIVLFVLVGILGGSLVGGAIGLKVANLVTGGPLQAGMVSSVFLAVSMLVGMFGSALMFTIGPATAGWAIGSVVDSAVRATADDTAKAESR